MADAQTNITDTSEDGLTTTTLVSDHDRGSLDFNSRLGEGRGNTERPPNPEKEEAD